MSSSSSSISSPSSSTSLRPAVKRFPGLNFAMTKAVFILIITLTVLHAGADNADHPYAFEKPVALGSSASAFFTHKVGIPFVERKGRPVGQQQQGVQPKVIDSDSDEFYVDNVPERDRNSSGEEEIRSKMFPAAEKKKLKGGASTTTTTTSSTTTKTPATSRTASITDETSFNFTLDDLLTSHNMPVPLSLKARKDFQTRMKSPKVESLKPKLRPKPKPRPAFEYVDDDEYYYDDDDDDDSYYDVELSPKKSNGVRRHADLKSRISKLQR